MSYQYSNEEIVKSHNSKLWLLVFYHNSSQGDYFTSIEQLSYVHTPHLFSILGNINEKYRIDGYYEFLYEVPGAEGYNEWKQKVHPFDTTTSSTPESIGFEEINLTWREPIFGGISRSTPAESYYSCCGYNEYESYWWFSIGARRYWEKPYTIPTFYFHEVSTALLWVRLPMTITQNSSLRILYKHLFISILLLS